MSVRRIVVQLAEGAAWVVLSLEHDLSDQPYSVELTAADLFRAADELRDMLSGAVLDHLDGWARLPSGNARLELACELPAESDWGAGL